MQEFASSGLAGAVLLLARASFFLATAFLLSENELWAQAWAPRNTFKTVEFLANGRHPKRELIVVNVAAPRDSKKLCLGYSRPTGEDRGSMRAIVEVFRNGRKLKKFKFKRAQLDSGGYFKCKSRQLKLVPRDEIVVELVFGGQARVKRPESYSIALQY